MQELKVSLEQHFADDLLASELEHDELTLTIAAENLLSVCQQLRDRFDFSQLMDLCGVDYAEYGSSGWETKQSTAFGFSRAVDISSHAEPEMEGLRYAVVYHLLSLSKNQRLRLKIRLDAASPVVDSVIGIWRCADWYEREAFDLFGILFNGHPDLRRLLTDYGFVGHPFRKDFPLSGHVEMRYDETKKRVIYEPVSIEPRTLVPRVIRDDNRYWKDER